MKEVYKIELNDLTLIRLILIINGFLAILTVVTGILIPYLSLLALILLSIFSENANFALQTKYFYCLITAHRSLVCRGVIGF